MDIMYWHRNPLNDPHTHKQFFALFAEVHAFPFIYSAREWYSIVKERWSTNSLKQYWRVHRCNEIHVYLKKQFLDCIAPPYQNYLWTWLGLEASERSAVILPKNIFNMEREHLDMLQSYWLNITGFVITREPLEQDQVFHNIKKSMHEWLSTI